MAGTAGYALGGLPAHRLLHRLGIRISRDTILRRVKSRIQALTKANVPVLAVDDGAWRKHQHYGTMLMDMESRRVVDLLPVRTACLWRIAKLRLNAVVFEVLLTLPGCATSPSYSFI